MPEIIQIFKSQATFLKGGYSPEARKEFEHWDNSIVSKTGFVKDKTLFLPEERNNEPDLNKSALILIQDIKGFDAAQFEQMWKQWRNANAGANWFLQGQKDRLLADKEQLFSFRYPSKSWDFEIFRFSDREEGALDLYLQYKRHGFVIGIPERDDHKVAEIKAGKAVRYRINGKSDFSMSGRRARRFNEYDYLIQHLGVVDKIEFLPQSKIEHTKALDLPSFKLIDERRILK